MPIPPTSLYSGSFASSTKVILFLIQFALLLVTTKSFISERHISRICQPSPSHLSSSLVFNKAEKDKVLDAKSRICIIGGGFGGLYTALKLAELTTKRDDIEITLIDSKDKFVYLPLLYELATGTASVVEVSPRYDTLLEGTKIKFIQSAVTDINLRNNEIRIADNNYGTIKYDQVVIAVGAQPRLDMVNGAAEYAIPFYRVEDAYELKLRLQALSNSKKDIIHVAVLGGGYSGVEVATNIASYLGKKKSKISIIDRSDKIMKNSPENNRKSAESSLNSLDIKSYLQTSALRVSKDAVHCKNIQGDIFDVQADIAIFTTGMEQSSLLSKIQLLKDSSGRIAVNQSLQCKSKPNVFALGDCSGINNHLIPSTAQAAMQQSDIVAKNLLYRINNYKLDDLTEKASRPDELEKFRFISLGEMLTLGSTDGAVSSLNGLIQLNGPFAAVARRLVYAARMPTKNQSVTALVSTGQAAVVKARKFFFSKLFDN